MVDGLVTFGVFGIATFFAVCAMLYKRFRWEIEAGIYTQVNIIPKAGKNYRRLGIVEGGMISVPEDKRRKKPPLLFPVPSNEASIYQTAYPTNFPIAMLRTTIDEITVWEYNWEPAQPAGSKPSMSPAKLYNYVNEKFTSQTVQASEALKETEEKLQKALTKSKSPVGLYVIGGFNIALAGFVVYMILPVTDQLTQLMAFIEGWLK